MKYYKSDKTFRRGTVWISELDLGVVSSSVLNSMLEFKVHRNMAFPSDHASVGLPLTLDMSYLDTTVIMSEKLLARASELFGYRKRIYFLRRLRQLELQIFKSWN